MKSYRELDVYKVLKALAVRVYALWLSLSKFKRDEEGSQVRRSSKSVTATTVEGCGRRRHKADFTKDLIYAQSDGDEAMVHLDFLFETKSLPDETVYKGLRNEYETLSKRMNTFIQWAKDSFKP